MRKKMKHSFIENETSRKRSFNKRKQGMMKKLTELATLCDVKACAVIYSPYNPIPKPWPSREGVEEVVSKFIEVDDRTKKMVDQEAFLRERIAKETSQLQKLRNENRNFQIRDIMFGCLRGEIGVHKLGEKDLQDLSSFIDKYLNQLTCRIENLMVNGESSSSLAPLVVADGVAVPVGNYDHKYQIPYQNQKQNQRKLIELQNDALINFFGQIPQKLHDFNMNMNLNSNQNMILDLNQYPNVEEDGDIPTMYKSHHQPETDGLATTDTDACAPNITNNLES